MEIATQKYYVPCTVEEDDNGNWTYVTNDIHDTPMYDFQYFAIAIREDMLEFYSIDNEDEDEKSFLDTLDAFDFSELHGDVPAQHKEYVLVFPNFITYESATIDLNQYIMKKKN